MFIEALFIIAVKLTQSILWLNKMWFYTMEYYLEIKKKQTTIVHYRGT